MLIVTLVISAIVAMSVVIHYEALNLLSKILPRSNGSQRIKVLFGVFGVMVAHAIEVWIFAICYFFMHHSESWGDLKGNFEGTILDCAYFSFTTYTTLGFGDITPFGHIRHLVGIEALTGLVLITWSASFLYIEMQRFWNRRE